MPLAVIGNRRKGTQSVWTANSTNAFAMTLSQLVSPEIVLVIVLFPVPSYGVKGYMSICASQPMQSPSYGEASGSVHPCGQPPPTPTPLLPCVGVPVRSGNANLIQSLSSFHQVMMYSLYNALLHYTYYDTFLYHIHYQDIHQNNHRSFTHPLL